MSIIFKTLQKMGRTGRSAEAETANVQPQQKYHKKKTTSVTVLIGFLVLTIVAVVAILFFLPSLKNILTEKKPYQQLTSTSPASNEKKATTDESTSESRTSDNTVITHDIPKPPPAERQYETKARYKTMESGQFSAMHSDKPVTQEQPPEPSFIPPTPNEYAGSDQTNPVLPSSPETIKESQPIRKNGPQYITNNERYERSTLSEQKIKKIKQLHISAARHNKAVDLVAQIHANIGANDPVKTRHLLDRLVKLTGNESDYSQKVRAYLLIQQQNYSDAIKILSELITNNPGDIDAQINMCVALYNANKQQEAVGRLNTLKRQYPGNEQIRLMMKQLR